jgi:hypothetical protein
VDFPRLQPRPHRRRFGLMWLRVHPRKIHETPSAVFFLPPLQSTSKKTVRTWLDCAA